MMILRSWNQSSWRRARLDARPYPGECFWLAQLRCRLPTSVSSSLARRRRTRPLIETWCVIDPGLGRIKHHPNSPVAPRNRHHRPAKFDCWLLFSTHQRRAGSVSEPQPVEGWGLHLATRNADSRGSRGCPQVKRSTRGCARDRSRTADRRSSRERENRTNCDRSRTGQAPHSDRLRPAIVGCFAGCRRLEAFGKAIAAGTALVALARYEGDPAPACRRVVILIRRHGGVGYSFSRNMLRAVVIRHLLRVSFVPGGEAER